MIGEGVAQLFKGDQSGKAAIAHGYTCSGHPVGAAAALACIAETQRLNVKDNAGARGAELYQGLLALKDKHEAIGDVRGGHGLMNTIELVSDRAARQAPGKATPGKVQAGAYKARAMVRVSGPNIILSPPLVLTSADVQVILKALDEGFAAP